MPALKRALRVGTVLRSLVDDAFRGNRGCLEQRAALNAVLQCCFAGRTCAMNAAIDLPIGFHTVPHDPAVAVWADRRQRVNRAFEAIECVMLSRYDHFKRLVIFILANFACSHTKLFRASSALRRCPNGFRESRDHTGK
jgi:hypothetical protein